MSAVATAETLTTADTPHLHAVEGSVAAEHKMHAVEMIRDRPWMGFGLGSIGRAVGALATAFGCRVVAVRRRSEEGGAIVLVWLAMSSTPTACSATLPCTDSPYDSARAPDRADRQSLLLRCHAAA
jgi:lactate dehydrogenase-like 2-hydroxyacid dehydrogenase